MVKEPAYFSLYVCVCVYYILQNGLNGYGDVAVRPLSGSAHSQTTRTTQQKVVQKNKKGCLLLDVFLVSV